MHEPDGSAAAAADPAFCPAARAAPAPPRVRELRAPPPEAAGAEQPLEGEFASLAPFGCPLGPAGRGPRARGGQAEGVWRGVVESSGSTAVGGEVVARLLGAAVCLDGCGALADAALPAGALRFLEARAPQSDEEASEVSAALGGRGPVSRLRLAGLFGQALSHSGELWLRQTKSSRGDLAALLRLRPLRRTPAGDRCLRFKVELPGPVGPLAREWVRVPLVELPRFLRLTMQGGGADPGALMTADHHLLHDEDILVVHCWRRDEEAAVGAPSTAPPDALELEQLLWCDAVSALSETAPCAEAPVPSGRLRLQDEGAVSRAELLAEPGAARADGDAARLASLAFLRQYVPREVLEEEALPRLLPGPGGAVRVLSAELAPRDEEPAPAAPPRPRPSLDELLSDADFCPGARPWAEGAGAEGDPLAQHELTSVFLVNETAGFALAFHCLQAIDPCAA